MNYIEVKKEIKKEFEFFLKPLGYKSKTDTQGCVFVLDSINMQIRIGYGVANYLDEFNTGIYLRVGIKPIQKIQNVIFEGEFFDTIVTGTADYFNEINYRYKIRTADDIKEWGKIAKKFYEEYAIPFFERYNTVASIDKLLNDNPIEKIKYLDDLGWRIITGLIAAKLNNNNKCSELISFYKSEVESKFQGYFMYDKCMKAIEFLDNHNRDELLKLV